MYLYNIILAVFAMYSLHGADIQASKHLSTRVHPETISKKSRVISNTDVFLRSTMLDLTT